MKPSSIMREHNRGGADLEERRDLAQVRVADDHMETAVLLWVGVRLVARVHDRALQRGLEPDLLLEEVGALADLEVASLGTVLGADLARARKRSGGVTNQGMRLRTSVAERDGRGRRDSSRGSRSELPLPSQLFL